MLMNIKLISSEILKNRYFFNYDSEFELNLIVLGEQNLCWKKCLSEWQDNCRKSIIWLENDTAGINNKDATRSILYNSTCYGKCQQILFTFLNIRWLPQYKSLASC